MISERYELAVGRIKEISNEETVALKFRPYFGKVSEFILMLHELKEEMESGEYHRKSLEELKAWNYRLYEDILPDNYEKSYANPAYAVKELGEELGQLLSFLYAEIRGAIVYTFEKKEEYLAILCELFVEIYNAFESEETPDEKTVKEITKKKNQKKK